MSDRLFGTDGVRGVANGDIHGHPGIKMDAQFAFDLGAAAGRYLQHSHGKMTAVLGRDTRRSGSMLGAALAAGLASEGVTAVTLGVIPTPGVSYVLRDQGFGLGIVISASHNPAADNGIKFFGPDGRKLSDEGEDLIQAFMTRSPSHPIGAELGTVENGYHLRQLYEDWLVSLIPDGLSGQTIVVDAANGAAYEIGVSVLTRLGAIVIPVNADPGDGMSINREGGATHPETVCQATLDAGADFGVAFDGDADRAVFSDSQGRLVNGDRVLAIWARQNCKPGDVIVGTVMSNLGFESYLNSQGVKLERAAVGDKYVSAMIDHTRAGAGGEQSGHTIFPALGPTGDGIGTALQVLLSLKQLGITLADAYDDFANWPQFMVNVKVDPAKKNTWKETLAEDLDAAERQMIAPDRILVRASGTSPTIRVMVEARDEATARLVTDSLVRAAELKLGGKPGRWIDLRTELAD